MNGQASVPNGYINHADQENTDNQLQDDANEYESMREARTCKFCKAKATSRTVLPCNHFVACEDCGEDGQNCPEPDCGVVIQGRNVAITSTTQEVPPS